MCIPSASLRTEPPLRASGITAHVPGVLRPAFGCLVILLFVLSDKAFAGGGPQNWLVVYDPADPHGVSIARYYQEARQVPERNMVAYSFPSSRDTITLNPTRAQGWSFLNSLKSTISARGLDGQIHGILLVGQAPTQIRSEIDTRDTLSMTTVLSMGLLATSESEWEANWWDQSNLFRGPLASQAGSGIYQPTTEIRSDIPFDGKHYWMAMHLGYTGIEGLRRDEVFDLIDRSVAADGLAPRGTVYWPLNINIRSEMREDQIPLTTAEWDALGLDYHVYGQAYGGGGFDVPEDKTGSPGSYPPEERLIQGAIVGGENIDIGGSGSLYIPGAIAEHVTSFGGKFGASTVLRQTAMVEWIRAGASGTSGTVQEPSAIAAKFPHSRIHSHYFRGSTLAEAFHQSVERPGELLLMGEPLTQPYAKVPEVTISTPVADASFSGTIQVLAGATRPGGIEPDLDLAIDGRIIRIGDAGETVGATRTADGFQIDTTTLTDGWHELRVIAYGADAIRPQGFATVEVTVNNSGGSVSLTGPTSGAFGDNLSYSATPSGLSDVARVEFRSLGRVLASRGATGGSASIDATAFSDASSNRLFAVAVLNSGEEVLSAPLEIEVQSSPRPALSEAPTLPGVLAVARYYEDVLAPGFDWDTATPTAVLPITDRWGLEVHQIDQWPRQGAVEDNRGGVEFITRLYAEETGLYDFLISGITDHTIVVDGERLHPQVEPGIKRPAAFLEKGWHEIRVLCEMPTRNNTNAYSLQPLFRNTQTRKFQPVNGYLIENFAPFTLANSAAPVADFTLPRLSVRPTGVGEAALSWDDPVSAETAWKVQRYVGDPGVSLVSYSGNPANAPVLVDPPAANAMRPTAPTDLENDGNSDQFTLVPPLLQTGTRLVTSRTDIADGGLNTLYEVSVPAGVTVYAIYKGVDGGSTPDWLKNQTGWTTFALPDGYLGKRVESATTSLWYIKQKTVTAPTVLQLGGTNPRGGVEEAITFVFVKNGDHWETLDTLPADSTSATVSGLTAGVERLRVAAEMPPVLTVPSDAIDADLSAAVANAAPSVNAGLDRQVAGTATPVALTGSAMDDGLHASPGSLTATWSKLSGPGTVSFADPSALATTVTVSLPGVYELQLSATDGSLPGADTLILTVTGGADANTAPSVAAGVDQAISIAENITLGGSVSDDGLPNPPGRVLAKWRQLSGPGTTTFLDDSDPQTTVNFSAPGSYVLELVGNDGALDASDTVTVTVGSDPNTAPLVDAGADQDVLITLPTATLAGSASDDGLPNPPAALSYQWSRLSGPGTATIASPGSPSTAVTFDNDSIGDHVFTLRVSDGGLTVSDTLTITVDYDLAGNEAPVVSVAQPDAVIFPDPVRVNVSATDDGLPDPLRTLTTSWEKLSGPGSFKSTDFLSDGFSVLAFDQPGQYEMSFSAFDGATTTARTVTVDVADRTTHRLVWVWGNASYGVAGPWGTTSFGQSTTPNPVGRGWIEVCPAQYFSYALTKDGRVLSTGLSGYLGEGGVSNRNVFSAIPGLDDVVDIASGTISGAALHADGTVSTWGANNFGGLGDPAAGTSRATPAKVPGLSGIRIITGNLYSLFAIKDDGSLWAWGYNNYGKLGLGTSTPPVTSPSQVPGKTDVKQAEAGYNHSAVLKNDGTVHTVGYNYHGQLGNGTSGAGTESTSHVQVLTGLAPLTPLTNIVKVALGDDFCLALGSDGRVWAWGQNNSGQIGQGTFTTGVNLASLVEDPSDPTGYLTDVVDIAAAEDSSFAVKSDGTVWGWGDATSSELFGPLYGTSDQAYPVQVEGLPAVTQIWAADETVFAATAWSTYDQWVSEVFTAQEIADGDADPDVVQPGTGLSNLLFYALDGDPKAGLNSSPIQIRTENGVLVVEYEALFLGDDIEIRLFSSTDLERWDPVDPADIALEDLGDTARHSVSFDLGANPPEMFFRIEVIRN